MNKDKNKKEIGNFNKKGFILNKGYTLLFAVIVASVVLSVGISILNISKKEYLLASSARESISAFYVADSGLECVMYNDGLGNFSTSSTSIMPINCINQITPSRSPIADEYGPYIFDFQFKTASGSGPACAIVKVIKSYNGTVAETMIESKGYNMGWNSGTNRCETASSKRVERAIRYSY